MRCNKCGKEIPGESEFCLKCGSSVKKQTTTSYEGNPKPEPKAQTEEKTENSDKDRRFGTWCLVISLLTILVCLGGGFYERIKDDFDLFFLVGVQVCFFAGGISKVKKKKPSTIATVSIAIISFFVVLLSMNGKQVGPTPITTSPETISSTTRKVVTTTKPTPQPYDEPNAEYTALLSKYSVDDEGNPFYNLDCESFAMDANGEGLMISHYGYKNDIVKQIKQIEYCKISGYSDADVAQLEETVRATVNNAYGSLDFAQVSYEKTSDYIIVTINFTGLEDPEKAGYLLGRDSAYISMKESVGIFLSRGYVQR